MVPSNYSEGDEKQCFYPVASWRGYPWADTMAIGVKSVKKQNNERNEIINILVPETDGNIIAQAHLSAAVSLTVSNEYRPTIIPRLKDLLLYRRLCPIFCWSGVNQIANGSTNRELEPSPCSRHLELRVWPILRISWSVAIGVYHIIIRDMCIYSPADPVVWYREISPLSRTRQRHTFHTPRWLEVGRTEEEDNQIQTSKKKKGLSVTVSALFVPRMVSQWDTGSSNPVNFFGSSGRVVPRYVMWEILSMDKSASGSFPVIVNLS